MKRDSPAKLAAYVVKAVAIIAGAAGILTGLARWQPARPRECANSGELPSAERCGLGKTQGMLSCFDLDSFVGAPNLCSDVLRGEVLPSKSHQLRDLLRRPAPAVIGPVGAHA